MNINNICNLYSLLYVFNTELKNSEIIFVLHMVLFIFKKMNLMVGSVYLVKWWIIIHMIDSNMMMVFKTTKRT